MSCSSPPPGGATVARRLRTAQCWPRMRSETPGAVTRRDVLFTIRLQGSRRRPSARPSSTGTQPSIHCGTTSIGFLPISPSGSISSVRCQGRAAVWLPWRLGGCTVRRRTADIEATSRGSRLLGSLLGERLERVFLFQNPLCENEFQRMKQVWRPSSGSTR
jgi:hypothetical protein